VRIELSYTGVGRNRVYYATEAKAGRPRKSAAIVKSKKVFATGSTKDEAITNYLEMVGFQPSSS
jgi:hypothetical protein